MDVHVEVVADPEAGDEAGDRLLRRLRTELAELDLELTAGEAASSSLPPGAKGVDPVTVGAVVLALTTSGGVFTALVQTLGDWLERQAGRHRVSVTVDGDTIELERATPPERQALVDAFVRRHAEA